VGKEHPPLAWSVFMGFLLTDWANQGANKIPIISIFMTKVMI
jgi:hypothetical protein